MKKTVAILVALVLTASVAFAKGYEVQKKAGEYDVQVAIDRNPPVAGDNNMTIAIKDATGKAVTDAVVKVDYSMPAMPGMPAMSHKIDAELRGNEYKAVMTFCMGGSWNIVVKITRAGKTTNMKFTVDAQ